MTLKQMNEKAKKLSDSKRVDLLMDYEDEHSHITNENILILFGNLIRTGMAWSLQSHYGRVAIRIIDDGFINRKGEIIKVPKGGN